MELDQNNLTALFPSISSQMRGVMNRLHIAADNLAPAERREQDPGVDEWASVLEQSFYQMLRLMDNLSDAMMLERTAAPVMRNGDIVKLVSTVCEKCGDLLQMRGLELKFICPFERHVCAMSSERIEHLLYHLLSNAMKFTPAGGTVTVELQRGEKELLLLVTDTGCGIPEGEMKTLFERYQHPDPLAPEPCGLGLGLALCKQIALDHDGTLEAESEVGEGSRFTLTLPDWKIDDRLAQPPVMRPEPAFNETLKWLSDALPREAFRVRSLD